MPTFAVNYRYADQPAALGEHRPAHRAFLAQHAEAGRLLAAGRFADEGPEAALLVFRAQSADDVAGWLDQDPFALVGLVAEREIRLWPVVLGLWVAQQ